MNKGQVEFIVIVGLLVVVSIAVFFAYQSGMITPSPPGPVEEQKLVKNSVENLIRDGAYETLSKLSRYGGYLDDSGFSQGSVTFLGKQVPYWQYNGRLSIPNIESNLREGILDYIRENKDSIPQSLKKDIEIGVPVVQSISILPTKIVITLNMPTSVQDKPIEQPYTVEIQTRFGEAIEFSRGFASYANANRPLEYYTLSSMLLSPMDNGIQDVPFFIFLTECGDFVYKDWYEIKPGVEYAIKVTLAHTYMPGKVPLNIMKTSSYPKYSLVPINGKDYENIDVSFHLPDRFELEPYTFQFTPDPIILMAEPIEFVGLCQSDPVYVEYYLVYPAIVRSKDPVTGNVFQYATQVFILNNEPGDWAGGTDGFTPGIQKEICENPQCSADITVKTSEGPLPDAAVTFMGCRLGVTDSNGRLRGASPCGIGPLEVYVQGYETHDKMYASNELEGLTITIKKMPVVRLHFYEVKVQNLSLSERYEVYPGGVIPLTGDKLVYMSLYSNTKPETRYQLVFDKAAGIMRYVPADDYMIGANLLAEMKEKGAFFDQFEITEEMDDKDLHVYLPSTLYFHTITDMAEKAEAIVILTNVLKDCGLGPVLTEEPEFHGCKVGYGEV